VHERLSRKSAEKISRLAQPREHLIYFLNSLQRAAPLVSGAPPPCPDVAGAAEEAVLRRFASSSELSNTAIAIAARTTAMLRTSATTPALVPSRTRPRSE
jgi:hypothetical protein